MLRERGTTKKFLEVEKRRLEVDESNALATAK
jgi:hypothetical protein